MTLWLGTLVQAGRNLAVPMTLFGETLLCYDLIVRTIVQAERNIDILMTSWLGTIVQAGRNIDIWLGTLVQAGRNIDIWLGTLVKAGRNIDI